VAVSTEPTTDPDDDRAVAVERVVERFAGVLVDAGWPLMPARIFAALLFDDDGRMTAAELADQLHISPAGISGAIRFLTQVNLASRERERGGRRDVYVVHEDAWIESIMARDQVLKHWAARLREGLDAVAPDSAASRRVGLSLAFAEFMLEELDGIAERWNKRKAELA